MSEARTCYTRPSRLPDADEPGAGFRVLCSYSHLVFDSCQQRQRHLILIRRQDVGILADSEGIRRSAGKRNRHVQKRSGAPGLDRTADTRFRKHVEGVTSRSAPCVIVLHNPRFCGSWVLGCPQACWAVVKRLVGNPAATANPFWLISAASSGRADRSSASTSVSARSPTWRSSPSRSRSPWRPSTRCGHRRRRGNCHSTSRTVNIHTSFGG